MRALKTGLLLSLLGIIAPETGLAQASKVKLLIVGADFSSDTNAKDNLFAVVVKVGSNVIWKTPFVKGEKPRWNKTVTVSSRFRNAIVVEVISIYNRCAKKAKKSDHVLAEAIEEFIGDYEDLENIPCANLERIDEEHLYCRTSTKWPEKPQSLVLPCGTGEIELRIKEVFKGKTP